jgi:hypothetical protein
MFQQSHTQVVKLNTKSKARSSVTLLGINGNDEGNDSIDDDNDDDDSDVNGDNIYFIINIIIYLVKLLSSCHELNKIFLRTALPVEKLSFCSTSR